MVVRCQASWQASPASESRLVGSLQAFADSEAQAPPGGLLDCEHPPKNLTNVLPKQVAMAATVICTPEFFFLINRHD